MEKQILFVFPEAPPIFKLRSRLKIVQAEQKVKFQRAKVEISLLVLYLARKKYNKVKHV